MDEQPSKKHPDGTECDMPPVNESGKAEGNAGKRYDDERQPCVRRWFPRKPYERWSLVFATLTLAVVVVYTHYAAGQWEASERAAAAATAAANAAIESNRLTRESNEIARKNAEASGRAWILPEIPVVGLQVSRAMPITVDFQNYGSTPAFNLIAKTEWTFSPAELPHDVVGAPGGAIVPPGKKPPVGVAVVAGIHHLPEHGPLEKELAGEKGLTQEQQDAIVDGRLRLYVGGLIRYDDAYGTGRETRWCTVYSPLGTDFMYCQPGEGVNYLH